ncbi:hypothetical protein N7G274_000673 [Stereocaulon virgatum]|uniref:Cytochrome P450 n=1 Tax=Stereocaulon virgatum TaxID=373712 RepID=A0ABR4AS07_9LECA
MAQQSTWLDRLEPFNLSTLTMPRVNIKTPFLEAFNHVYRITDKLLLDGPQIFPSKILLLIDRPIAVVTSCSIVYNLYISPLKNIPGPPLAKITSKWLTFKELAGNRSLAVAKAHEKYGPVIRLAPDELSFSDRSCIKELYMAGSKFPKSRRYVAFASGTRASFDMTDKDQHRERRNLIRHVLAQSNIDECEQLIADQVRKSLYWIPRVKGQSVEIMLW